MKKQIILLILTMLIVPTVNALGFGMIVNQDYGNVIKGETYTIDLKTWAMDSDYYPYTDNTSTYDITVKIESDDPFVEHPDEIISQINRWSYTPITLSIPNNARKGYYESKICATAISGGFFNVGCCQYIKYNIVNKGQLKSMERKWKNK